jgi:uncharacterized protein YprB with RNaseH-like and TPR domain
VSTLDDLRQIIRRIEGARPPRPAAEPIERVIGGEVLETGAGPLLVVRQAYPLGHAHGRRRLGDGLAAPPDVLRLVARAGAEPDDARGLLFVDTETTGLAGGTGTYAFLVGVGQVEGDAFVVTQYFMRDLDEEPALLAALAPRLERSSGLVSFNGSGFDLPLLETRFVLSRRSWPEALPQIDLMRPARRVWAACFPDCRLATVEREALGLARADDVPGAFIPALYFQYLRTRRAQPLARVFAHNRDDVLSLVALLGWFGEALAGAIELTPHERMGVGRLWERVDPERGVAWYRDALAAGLDGMAALWTCLRLAAWEKRRERWESACALWEAAARVPAFDPRPWEELAKFHEHRARDLAAARRVVTSALDRAAAAAAPPRTVQSLTYRLGRLERRLGAVGGAASVGRRLDRAGPSASSIGV